MRSMTGSSAPQVSEAARQPKRWLAYAIAVVLLTLGTIALLAPGLKGGATQAVDDRIDCSALKKWTSVANYRRGEFVWSWDGDARNNGAEYKCNQDVCHGGGTRQQPAVPEEPSFSSTAWQFVATCRTPGKADAI